MSTIVTRPQNSAGAAPFRWTQERNGESMNRPRVLIVEDDRSISEIVSLNLQLAGYEPLHAYDGQSGLDQAQRHLPDLIVLDLMLPVVDGYDVCRRLRNDSATQKIPILMLTARSDESDQLVGFSMGADDYVTKPFSVKILLERVKALLRRRRNVEEQDDVVSSQGVSVDRVRHRASVAGEAVHLTRSEFRLLDTLIRQPGRVFERTELIDAALGEDTMVMERTIDVHVRALRSKLGDRASLIETVRGVGYRFRDPDLADESSS